MWLVVFMYMVIVLIKKGIVLLLVVVFIFKFLVLIINYNDGEMVMECCLQGFFESVLGDGVGVRVILNKN